MSRLKMVAALLVVTAAALVVWSLRPQPPVSSVDPVQVDGRRPEASADAAGFLYGRVETLRGTYTGRLRFGGVQEAFWTDGFDAFKKENPWESHVDPERLVEEETLEVFGVRLGARERPVELRRPFRVAFGDLVSLEARATKLVATLKSGTSFGLDRLGADDFGDGLRVWDQERGTVDLDELSVRKIVFLPTPALEVPHRLYGRVRSTGGEFTGFIQWDRGPSVSRDVIEARSDGERLALRFGDVESIERTARGSVWTLRDGRQLRLEGTRSVGLGHRGVGEADPRFGRVVVEWESFEQLDLSEAGSGPAYDSFRPGRPLRGQVTLVDGTTVQGRLVYDLDESQSTDTLDGSRAGVDYAVDFARIGSIEPRPDCDGPARVTLRAGALLELDCSGDLGPTNAGLLVFDALEDAPIYVPWSDVLRVDLAEPAGEAPAASPTEPVGVG